MKGLMRDRRKADSDDAGEECIVRDEEIPAVDRAAAITVVIADLEDELSETRPGNSTRRDLLRLSVAELRNRRDSLIPQACREHVAPSFVGVSDDSHPDTARQQVEESGLAAMHEKRLREEVADVLWELPMPMVVVQALLMALACGALAYGVTSRFADSQTAMFVGVATSVVSVVLAAGILRNRSGR